MLIPTDNHTPEENYRLCSAVTDKQLQALLDVDAKKPANMAHLSDALCPISAGFLNPALKLLRNLHGNLNKSDIKDAIKYIINSLEDIEETTLISVEYSDSIIQDEINARGEA